VISSRYPEKQVSALSLNLNDTEKCRGEENTQLSRMAPRQQRRSSVAISAPTVTSPTNADGANTADTASSRRLRKRELDRRCQRLARERTKNRIAYLEGLVEDFRAQDSSGQVRTLMDQLADMSKERDLLAKTLQSIQNSIQSHRSLFGNSPQEDDATEIGPQSPEPVHKAATVNIDKEPAQERRASSSSDIQHSPPSKLSPPDATILQKSEDCDNDLSSAPVQPTTPKSLPLDPGDLVPSYYDLEDPIVPRTNEECECHPVNKTSINMWRYANEVLTKPTKSSRDLNELEDLAADDTPVRALIEGWDSVERRYGGQLPPSWQKLRRIDEVIFGSCNIRERLAIMRVMHKLLRFHTDPTPERCSKVPPWYLKRPSQTMAHSYAIDYFAW
jgi:hypothetical protein